jgi:hypothetical protein
MKILKNWRRSPTYVFGLAAVALAALAMSGCGTGLLGTAAGPSAVNLLTAGNYAILAKSGVSNVATSAITGDIGLSPAQGSYLTGFAPTQDNSTVFDISSQVTGKLYAANYGAPTPVTLTSAINDMQTAYTDAAGRSNPDHTELGAGEIGGLTLKPGLYKWGTGVSISTDVTLSGGASDVWIFQIGQGLTIASGAKVVLTSGAQAKNVFWQSAGDITVNSTAVLQGIAFSQTAIALKTGATANGRLFAQTDVSLEQSTVTQP